jgi:hypothetical protein
MDREITLVRVWGAALLAIAALMGCSGADSTQRPAAEPASQEVLRTRSDTARGRVWVLGAEDLRVYDAATKKLVRQIVLPEWSVARYECRPDLALDASGSAIVSNNIVPNLWRVDAQTFRVTEQAIALEGRGGWDIGFGPIALAADGTVYALTSNGMSLWKVAPAAAGAQLVETYLPRVKECALPETVMTRLGRSRS